MEELAELSLNSIVGLSTQKNMKVRGKLAQQEIITLTDCGATHNFISNMVVKHLGLPLDTAARYGVLMGQAKL